jgi:hypothetical protein
MDRIRFSQVLFHLPEICVIDFFSRKNLTPPCATPHLDSSSVNLLRTQAQRTIPTSTSTLETGASLASEFKNKTIFLSTKSYLFDLKNKSL